MTHPNMVLAAVPDPSVLLTVAVPVTALALAMTGWAIRYRRRSRHKPPGSPAVKVAALAALGCTAYSADTSWRFATDYLDMAGTAERAAMFAAAEFALFSTALMARQNLTTRGAPGLPGTLVWLITGVQIIPAYAESGLVGGTVRAFVGPIMAAMLWHQAMGIELRLRTPGATSQSLIATLTREARERLLSRLGIATRDRDAAQITRDRATTRAVTLAARLAERTPEQRESRRGRRLTRRLSKAIGRAAVGTDPAQRAVLLDQLAARRHALALATVDLPSPWSGSTPVPASDSEAVPPLEGTVPETGPRTHHPRGDRGPYSSESGTDHTRDRGPSPTDTGTNHTRDRGPSPTDTGTNHTRDRGPSAPLPRKPTAQTKSQRGSRARSRVTQQPSRELQASVDRLVEQVGPHVPALLERDGNASVTRVQLREILRREGLIGGRNERLSLVLQQLRSDANTTSRSRTL